MNLIEEVKKRLEISGLKIQSDQNFLQNPMISEVMNEQYHVQRAILNRFWLIQLARFNSESMEERYCLVENGSPEEWLKLFDQKIIPFLISKNLPVKIH